MRAYSSYSLGLLILSVFPLLRSQNPPANGAAPPAAQTPAKEKCTATGAVLAASTGAPLAKAGVILQAMQAGVDSSYAITTGDDGKFALTNVEPGKYILRASRDGYVNQSYNSTGSRNQAQILDLQPGQVMNNLKLKLLAQGVIAGRVLDADGEPLPNVQVQCRRMTFRGDRRVMASAGFASTNDLGEFRLFNLSPGKCYLSASRRTAWVNGLRAVTEGPSRDYAPTYYPSTTDLSSASPVQVAAGQTVRGIDLTLLTVRAHHVSGFVKNIPSGKSAFVQLMRASNDVYSMDVAQFQMARSRDGYFEFNGVTPADYTVSTQPIGTRNERVAAIQSISVGDEDVANLNLVLAPLPSLPAVINSTDPTTCPPKNIVVNLQPKLHVPYGGWAHSNADDKGELTLDGVVLVPYSLFLSNLPDGCYLASIRLGEEPVTDGQLDFSLGMPSGQLSVSISPRAPNLSGVVKDASDSPTAGVRVVLAPADETRHWSALIRTASTDQNGNYSLKNLIPGAYQLYAWQDIPSGAWLDPDVLKQFSAKSVSVSLKQGDQLSEDLTVIPASETKDIE